MKKTLLIIGGFIVLLVGAVVSLALWFIGKQELELNRKRTEKAREARIENLRKTPNEVGVEFTELNNLANEKS